MLPSVDFCGIRVTRLVIGANPFGGFSHQNPERDRVMRAFYSSANIIDTWKRAEAAGINTMITNNETEHVMEALEAYLSSGGSLQWIAQVTNRSKPSMRYAVDEAVAKGCKGLYFHGALGDASFADKNSDEIRSWCKHAHSRGVPVGVAAHNPEAHLWLDQLGVFDFHAVCFFDCGSLHNDAGEKFRLGDAFRATETIRRIKKPCIGYKILGAGRIDARMGFEYAFENIKPGDVVNVGMHRGDNNDMVEENAALVREILNRENRTS